MSASSITCSVYRQNKLFNNIEDKMKLQKFEKFCNNISTIGNVCIHSVKHEDCKKYSAFMCPTAFFPRTSNHDEFKRFLMKEAVNYDFAEVLRIDQSRLFFDLDFHDLKEFAELDISIQIILKIAELTKTKIIGLIEYSKELEDYSEDIFIYKEKFGDVLFCYTDPKHPKLLSGHLYLIGKYFNREQLAIIFKSFAKTFHSFRNLDKVFDTSIYKTSQQVFRHPLSSKMQQEREANPNIRKLDLDWDVVANFTMCPSPEDEFVDDAKLKKIFTKLTSEGNNVFTYNEFEFILTKPHENTKHDSKVERIENFVSAADFKDVDIDDIVDNVKLKGKFNEWYKSLCVFAGLSHKYENLTKEEIKQKILSNLDKFGYIHSFNETVDYSDFSEKSIDAAIEYGVDNSEKYYLPHNQNLKYHSNLIPFDEALQILAGQIFKWSEAISLINATFAFTPDYFIRNYNNNFDLIPYNKIQFRDERIKIWDLESSEPIYSTYSLHTLLKTLNNKILNFYKSSDVCSLNSNIFHLYNLPTKPKTQINELDYHWIKIFEMWASDDNEQRQKERFDYIIKWLAYVLQHPENRNTVALCISSKQGIGKSTVTKALKDFMGSFLKDNAKLSKCLQQFNSARANRKLICFNEVKAKKDQKDDLKDMITEACYDLENKGINCKDATDNSSKLFFSNNLDMHLTEENEESRRFMYFITRTQPQTPEFYKEIYDNTEADKVKPELVDNLVNYLLGVDLTEYEPNNIEKFKHLSDLKVVQEIQESKQHDFIQFLNALFKSDIVKTYKQNTVMIYSDIVKFVNEFNPDEEPEQQNSDVLQILQDVYPVIKQSIKSTVINKILQNEHNTTKYIKRKSNYRDETRGKQIIELI